MILVFLFSCGASLPPALENPYQHPHIECDPQQHFWAKGIGDSPQSSINSAHREVSSQIISQIQSQTKIITEYEELVVKSNGITNETSKSKEYLLSEINTKTTFEHNELIRNVIPPQAFNGQYYMLACLNKMETGKVLTTELAPKLDRFSSLYNKAIARQEDGDLAGFSSLYNQAKELSNSIVPELYIIRSVTGKSSRLESIYRRQWSDVTDRATEIRSKITIGLNVQSDEEYDFDPQLIQDVLRKGIEQNGLRVVNAGECSNNISHLANIALDPNCSPPGTMGIICKPNLEVNLQHCSTDEMLTIGIRHKSFSGQDYYTEKKALRNAINKLLTLDIGELMNQELRNIFPITK